MKSLKLLLIVAALGVSAYGSQTSAQVRFGVKAGVEVSKLHFDNRIIESNNRAGFTGGLMMEFTVPVVGIGFDLSAMYARRSAEFAEKHGIDERSYIEIPLNLKYKLGIPGIGSIIKPYLATGPSVAFLTSKQDVKDAYHNKSVDWAWNFGAGFELFKHLQVGASYGLGLSNAVSLIPGAETTKVPGKNRYWTVTAAYLF